MCLALMHVDRNILSVKGQKGSCGGSSTWWVQASAWLAFLVYIVAECVSYYNVATTNEWWAGFEVFLDGASFLCMAPASIYLLCRCPGKICGSSGKIYLLVMSILCLAYPAYNFCVDVPMYLKRYHADQANNTQYMKFWPGIADASTRRVVTHRLADWSGDMAWMTMYFLAGAWGGIAMMCAPRVKASASTSTSSAYSALPTTMTTSSAAHALVGFSVNGGEAEDDRARPLMQASSAYY